MIHNKSKYRETLIISGSRKDESRKFYPNFALQVINPIISFYKLRTMKTTSLVFFCMMTLCSAFTQQSFVKGKVSLVNYAGKFPAGTEITFSSGSYSYSTHVAEDGSFQVPSTCPEKAVIFLSNDSHLRDGVTLNDLARIQKHVTGVEFITDFLLLQASDVNNDRKVNSADLTILRQMILGLTSKWPNGQPSWRFAKVPESVSSPGQPTAYNYTFQDIKKHPVLKFYGIKTGDVDGSAL